MRLQSMTDFVLQQNTEFSKGKPLHETNWEKEFEKFSKLLIRYAEFIRHLLTLGMFIPVDEEGNVLEEPSDYDYYVSDNEQYFNGDVDECKKYVEAKEKVLFKGFQWDGSYAVNKEKLLCVNEEICLLNENIESYVSAGLELTTSALKQIGLTNGI